MNSNESVKDVFLDSLERCLESEAFIPQFYDRFLSSSDEIRNKFRYTDFEKQNKMLAASLRLVAAATQGNQEGLHELNARAETHDRYHLNIKPELYDVWMVTVIDTARDFDRQWTGDVESAWHQILQYAVDKMIRKY